MTALETLSPVVNDNAEMPQTLPPAASVEHHISSNPPCHSEKTTVENSDVPINVSPSVQPASNCVLTTVSCGPTTAPDLQVSTVTDSISSHIGSDVKRGRGGRGGRGRGCARGRASVRNASSVRAQILVRS